MKQRFLILLILIIQAFSLEAQITQRERPKEWDLLVEGGRFRDRFLPMPKGVLTPTDNWGADGVMKRYVDNGVEDKIRSYWGGNILHANDGKYHLFVCGWLESSAKGHMEWPRSIVYHAVSNNSIGPFQIRDTIGAGHNPEMFIAKNGQYVVYVINGYYVADHYNGPWEYKKFKFEPRDRPIIEGLSNLTFAKRKDGSNLMVCRGGGIWFSETGLSPYKQVSDKRVYPNVVGEFEDPVVWRDHVQYHLIVNDWLGRIAFYQRSKDGVNWVTDPGEAYVPGIAIHEDGTKEDWFKYERIKVLQDKYGRAYQANFAVIDTLKKEDKANDKYSSKNISIPLNPGLLIEMINSKLPDAKTKSVAIKILKEPNFDPATELDIKSLRFGTSEKVNYGKGSKVLQMKKVSDGVVIHFENVGHGLTVDEFAPKLIGKSTSGRLVYGYTRVPWVKYDEAILSVLKPVISELNGKKKASVEIENFGLVSSKNAGLSMYAKIDDKWTLVAAKSVPDLNPYKSINMIIDELAFLKSGEVYLMRIVIEEEKKQKSSFEFSMKI